LEMSAGMFKRAKHGQLYLVPVGEGKALYSRQVQLSLLSGCTKLLLFIGQALLGYARIALSSSEAQGEWAANGGLYPFMHKYQGDPYTRIAHVSFRQRSGGEPGAFFDYTARYGAMREAEDRVTVRESLLPNGPLSPEKQTLFLKLIVEMNLEPLLDLPILTLSNGQTRRARVVKAILDEPEVLLLDEPLSTSSVE